jgi:farnesyl diphosphate synthase
VNAPDDFDAWCHAALDEVEAALTAWVPAEAPAGLGEAMRYGVLDGGKRLRPLLVLAACDGLDGHREAALRAAVAVELIHAYSLIHDDMPCMDNDVLRRGKPTVHVQFGEAQAMLAGDAMQALAFEVLTPDETEVALALQARLVGLLARSAGAVGHGRRAGDRPGRHRPAAGRAPVAGHAPAQDRGPAAGQRADGCGLRAARGAGLAGAVGLRGGDRPGLPGGRRHPRRDPGLRTLGKTAGKDLDANKPTYVSVLGLERARERAGELHAQAQAALRGTAAAGAGVDRKLMSSLLADKVVDRES